MSDQQKIDDKQIINHMKDFIEHKEKVNRIAMSNGTETKTKIAKSTVASILSELAKELKDED